VIDRRVMERFSRSSLGEGIGLHSATIERLFERKQRDCGPKTVFPVHTDVRWDSHRTHRRVANAGPNAPLLIRLVRYPYVMRPTPMERSSLPAREALPEKTPFGEVLRDNATAWMKPAKHRPAKGRVLATSPDRLDGSAWIAGRNR
jgi:hypothetical protein